MQGQPCTLPYMELYIDNLSALYFFSMVESSLDAVSQPCAKTRVRNAVGSRFKLERFELSHFNLGNAPLHVMVGDAKKRSQSKTVVCHVRSTELPSGALRRIGKNIFIASPELCFFEMAGVLSFPKLIEFGYLLCGTYTVSPSAPEKNKREPLTTKRKLESFAKRMKDPRGRATALKALSYVVEKSASPRETKTAILLALPVRLGGYGFDLPQMNYKIDFSARERELFGKSYVLLDLYWPLYRIAIEYDGHENHSSPDDLARDRRKSSEMSYRGIEVIRVDKQQMASPFQVHVLSKKLARAMGKRFRKPTPQEWERKVRLFQEIMR